MWIFICSPSTERSYKKERKKNFAFIGHSTQMDDIFLELRSLLLLYEDNYINGSIFYVEIETNRFEWSFLKPAFQVNGLYVRCFLEWNRIRIGLLSRYVVCVPVCSAQYLHNWLVLNLIWVLPFIWHTDTTHNTSQYNGAIIAMLCTQNTLTFIFLCLFLFSSSLSFFLSLPLSLALACSFFINGLFVPHKLHGIV